MRAAAKLHTQVLLWQALFSLGSGALVCALGPALLLLNGSARRDATLLLMAAVGTAIVVSTIFALMLLSRRRYLLRALVLGSVSIDAREINALADMPWRLTLGWLSANVTSLAVGVLLRPATLDRVTALNSSLLGIVISAAASLPLYVLVRSEVSSAVELVPAEVMRQVLESAARTVVPAKRVSRRILAAVTTPVAFLALGSALIASAHLRSDAEREREETARLFVQAVLADTRGAEASSTDAIRRAAELGFETKLLPVAEPSRVTHTAPDTATLVVPVGRRSAVVRFSARDSGALNAQLVVISFITFAIAVFIGRLLGHALTSDLKMATSGVQLLGTDVVLSGASMQKPRFRAVGELVRAIERLAVRFRVFTEAQVRAIEAREAATRMRGLFFASVSHDLRGPLNAILGFSELVRRTEALSPGQLESLTLIERRGRELLALVETILDAARVEAGQLKLVTDEVPIGSLLASAAEKGRDLAGENAVEAVLEFAAGVPALRVDRLRMGRALATFIGHATRTAERAPVRVRASSSSRQTVLIEVEIPSRDFSARQLEAMLNPNRQPGASPHRGLALALGLARSMVELHGGSVRVEDRGSEGAAFLVQLPLEARLAQRHA